MLAGCSWRWTVGALRTRLRVNREIGIGVGDEKGARLFLLLPQIS